MVWIRGKHLQVVYAFIILSSDHGCNTEPHYRHHDYYETDNKHHRAASCDHDQFRGHRPSLGPVWWIWIYWAYYGTFFMTLGGND